MPSSQKTVNFFVQQLFNTMIFIRTVLLAIAFMFALVMAAPPGYRVYMVRKGGAWGAVNPRKGICYNISYRSGAGLQRIGIKKGTTCRFYYDAECRSGKSWIDFNGRGVSDAQGFYVGNRANLYSYKCSWAGR